MVAAYNAGRGTVQQWTADNIWDGNPDELDRIPFEETRLYVGMVLKNYEAYKVIYSEP